MNRRRYDLVMAIYPNTRGFAFVLFEGSLSPVDWQVVEVRGRNKNKKCLEAIARRLAQFTPDALVLEDISRTGTRRARRIRELNEMTLELAWEAGIPAFMLPWDQIRQQFGAGQPVTKRFIAVSIVKHLPVFERYLPPIRKPWMSEDPRMGLFNAAVLGVTFFTAILSHSQPVGAPLHDRCR